IVFPSHYPTLFIMRAVQCVHFLCPPVFDYCLHSFRCPPMSASSVCARDVVVCPHRKGFVPFATFWFGCQGHIYVYSTVASLEINTKVRLGSSVIRTASTHV